MTMMANVRVFQGGPGTGKTTKLIEIVTTAINGGNISDIATSGIIGGLTAGAAAGWSGSELLKSVTENMDPKTAQMITSATGRSVGGALTAVLQGKDPILHVAKWSK